MQSGRMVIISSEIAQGGFSIVYKARDTDTGEAFALKKIICQAEEQVQLAKAEIRAHKAFAHPNIMPLADYAVLSTEEEAYEYYLLFPYMESGTLRDMINTAIRQDVRIPEAHILDMFLQICRAVAELHSNVPPLAHRDIKPENIMLSDEGEPLLTDFGSVTTADVIVSGRSDALLLQEYAAQYSSMAYRAPELYEVPANSHITSATDVWSLGCLLYAMAFGFSPFECSFYDSGVVRVVECTYLAVIGPIKFPKNCSYSSKFCEMIRWILNQDATTRPTVFDIIERLHNLNKLDNE
ncbi:nak mpsk protein kinase [Plasmopara halstedii]|uniref:Nak mpsk protein kinase n=1 Tax=Plasmopara halstedii TaxID=4781 RepID=A0A0P1B435_PLAHL|nr:nak mpsk protein kinase [Plasmopara halstedii]CEG48885.1 nak mpsk protein kinase [Plasmopara halstedii]|eukprot:XP_024585254.1 nak mpsk protein kinase [Plasmopara halstedii]